MPNYNALIYTAADYKITLFVNNVAYPLQTVDNIDQNESAENEVIYAVGTNLPIGNKTNAESYGGRLGIQNGELNAILLLQGYPTAIRITNATIAITAFTGGYAKTYTGVNIHGSALNVKSKDKQSVANLDFTALAII